ncbi:MAG TPA: lysozyme inhibitor LprI family protein, partial [Gemmatimonadaceae bacterium]|nr:lysozyme inhibitor LprI family protein [Gemmatimonadaceae bacterium]
MKFPYQLLAVVWVALLAGGVGCSKTKESAEAATVTQDSMLLRDLAEANKNTASASAVDNSLNTVRTSGDGSVPVAGNEVSPTGVTPTRVVPRPAPDGNPILMSGSRPAPPLKANDGSGPTTVSTDLSPARGGDPCDSPAAVDQRSCLNRSIARNDADLNQTYQELIAQSRKSGGEELEQRFRQAQRDWVNERDSECRTSG